MAQYRRATIAAPYDPGVSGTEIIQIYLKELVSRFIIRFGITIATAGHMTDILAAAIKKIEIVDGSTVLFSLSGPEAVASAFYRTGIFPIEHLSLTIGDIAYFEVPINFGRWLWDTMLAFDPSRFVSPQLRITWDSTIPNAAVTTTSLAVYADVMDNVGTAPTGIILSKEQNQYNLAASAHKYVDLPVDYALSRILFRVESYHDSPSVIIDNFKFSYDQDAYVFVDQAAPQYIDALTMRYPTILQDIVLDNDVAQDFLYTPIVEKQEISINYDETPFVTASTRFSIPSFLGKEIALSASVDIKKLTARLSGLLPHGVIPFDFGILNDPTTWYHPQATTKFRADILTTNQISGGDTAYVVTEQLRPY